ncbi:MAG: hypothetical protein ACRD9R_08935 [Pyrinomonadaceae bacterium]
MAESQVQSLDEYDARMVRSFLEERWGDFLSHLEEQGEKDPEEAAEDITFALGAIIAQG